MGNHALLIRMDSLAIERLMSPFQHDPGKIDLYTIVIPRNKNELLEVFRHFIVSHLKELPDPDEFEETPIVGNYGRIGLRFRVSWYLYDPVYDQISLSMAFYTDAVYDRQIEIDRHSAGSHTHYGNCIFTFFYPGEDEHIEEMQSILGSYL